MRWGNYYLTADTRISLRKENVVLWENTLNSSPQVPPLGFKKDGRRILICVPEWKGGGGKVSL